MEQKMFYFKSTKGAGCVLYSVVSDVNGLNTKDLSKISSSLHLVERWEGRRRTSADAVGVKFPVDRNGKLSVPRL